MCTGRAQDLVLHTLWLMARSWPGAAGGGNSHAHRGTVPAPPGEPNPAMRSGLHSQFLAEAQKASWAWIPDSLLMSGKASVGAKAQQDTAGPGSNSEPLSDALGITEAT